ncbi:hypothetical protein PUV47_03625 [Pseudovibrio exalbescens]|uniref:hypothetical protein n=1 Tax=Pseudovibrio exalbescens TaxID=197461 RepID=UPI002365EF60|nr:hypothetical protein [Pseudovibrio exalbescens]MDD7908992.1 hypothetical protein [Pseudovibrio exalbescens]
MSETTQTSLVAENEQHQQVAPLQTGEPQYISSQDLARLEAIIARAEQVIEEEIDAISTHKPYNMEEASFRKSKVMLELERAGESISMDDLPSAVVERLQNLQERVALNLKLLSTQLDSVKDLSGKLASAIREMDSDGTYDASAGGW